MRLFVPFSRYSSYLSKVVDFNPHHLYLAPPYGMTPAEFCGDFRHQKTRVPGLSRGVVFLILLLAVLVEHRLVKNTDRHRHRAIAYTALAQRRAVKITGVNSGNAFKQN